MRIAVTGALGFIGHELVDRLVKDGHEVIAVDYYQKLIQNYESARLPIMQELYRILPGCNSVVDPWEFVEDLGTKYFPQVVVHAGAIVDTKNLGKQDLFQQNLRYTEILTEACRSYSACIIFISSAAVYGMNGFPNNPYGLTKAIGEKIIGRNSLSTACLRLFNVFGRYEHHKGEMASVPWKIAKSFETKQHFSMHSFDAERDFVPSSIVVSSIVKIADEIVDDDERCHRLYDVGTGEATSFRSLSETIAKLFNVPASSIVKQAGFPNELIGRFQTHTCAGENGIENIGLTVNGTVDGIKVAYGNN